jgi:riboflavin synthase
MFTGIIQKLAEVTQIEPAGESTRIRLASGFTDLESGESIAVNGVCLTVTEFDAQGRALFFVSPETLDKSNLGALRAGALVNLERAVTLGTRLSGHLVQGHVDGMGKLLDVEPRAESYFMRFEIPARLARYCVEKGSIAINGVSLTINFIETRASGSSMIGITLIPHTWTHTQFSRIRPGDAINVEVDVLAKYVESLSRPYSPEKP